MIDVDRFNVRRRSLVAVMEAIRQDLRDQKLVATDTVRLVDSAPVTLMTYTRGQRCVSVVGNEYFGVVTSKKGKFFGLRLHMTCTAEQLIDQWCVAPAATHDLQVLEALVSAYNDAELEARLWRKRRILLLPLRRRNQQQQWPEAVRQVLGRVRHRVETAFSTLTTTFNVRRPRGRSLAGHVVRIATCILAHTLSFFMV